MIKRIMIMFAVLAAATSVALPSASATSGSIVVSRSGASGSMTFNWVNRAMWNSGTLVVRDTSCDAHAVHVNIWDTSNSSYEGRRDNNSGCGTSVPYSPLSFNSTSYNIHALHLQGCVNETLADQCTNGANVYNPYA